MNSLEQELKVTQDIYGKRLSMCKACDNLISGMCIKCGCYVEIRAALKDKCCPDYDNKKWYSNVYEANYGKEANIKLLFTKTMNKKVYIKVENEKGYQSYAYQAMVKIDKKAPNIKVNKNNNFIMIYLTDNVGLSSVQYSFDGINWDDKEISGKKVTLKKEDFEYKYVRTIDLSGNISDVKEVK